MAFIAKSIVEAQFYCAFALQVLVAVTLYVRALHRKVRYFYAYVIWQTIAVTVMYAMLHLLPYKYFFYSYWGNNVVNLCLGLAIIAEVFHRIFEPYESIRHFARLVLRWSALLLTVIGAILTLYRQVAFTEPLLTVFMVAERSVRIVQLGLILCLFALSRYLHLRWKNYIFGVSLGFGFYALVVLAGLTVRMFYGRPIAQIENILQGTAYCIALMIWSYYVLQPDVVKIPIVSLPSVELERWDHALSELLGRIP